MAQTDFFFGAEDEAALVALCFERNATLYPCLRLENSELPRITSRHQYTEFIGSHKARHFLAVFSNCEESPLVTDQITEGPNRGKWFIRQRKGGPALELFFSVRKQAATGMWQISSGFVGYYPTYWSTLQHAEIATPPGLTKIYREITKEMRKHALLLTSPQSRKFYVCRALLERHTGDKVDLLGLGPTILRGPQR